MAEIDSHEFTHWRVARRLRLLDPEADYRAADIAFEAHHANPFRQRARPYRDVLPKVLQADIPQQSQKSMKANFQLAKQAFAKTKRRGR